MWESLAALNNYHLGMVYTLYTSKKTLWFGDGLFLGLPL